MSATTSSSPDATSAGVATRSAAPAPCTGATTAPPSSVDVQRGSWHCFKCDASGDFLKWIAYSNRFAELGESVRGDAWKRTLDEARRITGMPVPSLAPVSETAPAAPTEQPSEVKALLDAAAPIEGTPAEPYLIRERMAWPENSAPPTNVHWMPIGAIRELNWSAPPAVEAEGAIAYAMKNASGEVRAFDMDALTADGVWPSPRFRRTRGEKKDAWFSQNGAAGDAIGIAEGPLTALALIQLKTELTEARAVGGMNLYRPALEHAIATGRRAILYPDGGGPRPLRRPRSGE